VNESGRFADVFCQVSCEGDYIVVGGFFDLINSLDRKTRARLDLNERVLRDCSHLCVDFANSDFHFQPLLKLALFTPERSHFGKCVTFDHL
jgi:hypothetical protein